MGRLFSLILVTSILVPFFAAAAQVDSQRRAELAVLLAKRTGPTSHFTCRPRSEACMNENGD